MRVHRSTRVRGFSLIELMIAMTLGLLMLASVGSVFVYGSRSYKQDDKVSRLYDEMRFAMGQMSQDLEMAGFWGPFVRVENIVNSTSLAVNTDCGASGTWAYEVNRTWHALSVGNNVTTGANANTLHRCIAATEFYTGPNATGTDILAIKRVHGVNSGTDTVTTDMTTGRVYFRTNGLQGLLYTFGRTPAPTAANVATPNESWLYRPAVYFIRNSSRVGSDDKIPTLCRKHLEGGGASGNPYFKSECLARGVENMQVEVGVDASGDLIPDFFTGSPTQAQLASAVAIRVHLLVRSMEPDFSYTNEKTYTVGGVSYTPSATPIDATDPSKGTERNYYRKVLSTQIILRNNRSRMGLGLT